jgi:hypothetical protein
MALGTRGRVGRCRRRWVGARRGAAQGVGLARVGHGHGLGSHKRRGARGGGAPGGARAGEHAATGGAAAGRRRHDAAAGAGGVFSVPGGGAA